MASEAKLRASLFSCPMMRARDASALLLLLLAACSDMAVLSALGVPLVARRAPDCCLFAVIYGTPVAVAFPVAVEPLVW